MMDRWEMGSEFHWEEDYIGISPHQTAGTIGGALFASARMAIEALAQSQDWCGRTLHVPSYFCPEVIESLANTFKIARYRDYPTHGAPDFSSIRAVHGDIVLAMNYFGTRPEHCWAEWISENPYNAVLEDYSHDPNAMRMLVSPAQYVIVSLRKTMPIPDGGLVMSPKGLPLPTAPMPLAGTPKLEAMLLKSFYLRGLPVGKCAFRQLQIDGENALCTAGRTAPSMFTSLVLNFLDLESQRARRRANVKQVIESDVLASKKEYFRPLFSEWPDSATPYNVIFQCESSEIRDGLRGHLIKHQIYPAVHWAQEGQFATQDRLSRVLSERLLTIPCDFRYDAEDIIRLLEVLDSFYV